MAKSALSRLEKPIEQIQDVMRQSDVTSVNIWKRRNWDREAKALGKTYFGYNITTDDWGDEAESDEEA